MVIALDADITGGFNSASSGSVTLDTLTAGDEIVVVIANDTITASASSVTSSPGIAFTNRVVFVAEYNTVEVWFGGYSGSGNVAITVHMSASCNFAVVALGIKGLPTVGSAAAVWDANSSLTGSGEYATGTALASGSASTTSTADFAMGIAVLQSGSTQSVTKGNVFGTAATSVLDGKSGTTSSDVYAAVEYLVLSAAKSSLTSTITAGESEEWAMYEDAVVGYYNTTQPGGVVPRGIRKHRRPFFNQTLRLPSRRGRSHEWGSTPRAGVTGTPPKPLYKRKRRGLLDQQPPKRLKGTDKVWGRIPRVGATGTPPHPLFVTKKRGLTPPTTRGGRGKTEIIGRLPRVGVQGHPPEPLRKLKRPRALPRGRSRTWGRTPRVGVTTRLAPPERIQSHHRRLPLPRGRSKKLGRLPLSIPPSLPPRELAIRTRKRLMPLKRGKAKAFGRGQRIGVIGRPPKPIRLEHRQDRVPKLRNRRSAMTRTPPPVLTHPPPSMVTTHKRKVTPLRKGRMTKTGHGGRFQPGRPPEVTPIRRKRHTLMPPKGSTKVTGPRPGTFQPGKPPVPTKVKHRPAPAKKGRTKRSRLPEYGAKIIKVIGNLNLSLAQKQLDASLVAKDAALQLTDKAQDLELTQKTADLQLSPKKVNVRGEAQTG